MNSLSTAYSTTKMSNAQTMVVDWRGKKTAPAGAPTPVAPGPCHEILGGIVTKKSIAVERYSDQWIEMAQAFIERRIDVDSDGCWIPRLKLDAAGYVRTTFRYVHYYTHRLSYEAFVGRIPEGMVIDHLCRVTACCNPTHLESVTVWENTLRSTNFMAKRARQTHCLRGHEFTAENTRLRGHLRSCRACLRNAPATTVGA